MPYTDSGLIPDIIINPHGTASRMVMNTIMEMYVSKLNTFKGFITDGTAFNKFNIHDIIEIYKKDVLTDNDLIKSECDDFLYG